MTTRSRDGLSGMFGLALAGAAAVTLVVGPVGVGRPGHGVVLVSRALRAGWGQGTTDGAGPAWRGHPQ